MGNKQSAGPGSQTLEKTQVQQITQVKKVRIKNAEFNSIQVLEKIKIVPVSQGQDQNVLYIVNGNDQRRLCQTPNQFPFSVIGILYLVFNPMISAFGTAFLIGINIALTAAHNIYTRQHQNFAQKVQLILTDSDGKKKIYNVVCAYFPKEYKNEPSDKAAKQFDFALLILQSSELLQKKQVLTINQYLKIKDNDQILIYGYPEDLNKIKNQDGIHNSLGELKLFGCKHFISEVTERMIIHTVDTSRGQSGSPILKWNDQRKIYEVVGIHTKGHQLINKNGGVRLTLKVLIRLNEWKKDFSLKKQHQEQVMFIKHKDLQILQKKKVQITPDTTTYAWKQKKDFRQDNANKNVCIYQGEAGKSDWLCSSDLCDGECVFTIKVHKVYTYKYSNERQVSFIKLGLMDSNYKGKEYWDTFNHCVYLYIGPQYIGRPNQKQTMQEQIDCSCQSSLSSVPCLIECHVNRNQNTITWHYNGKHQANSTIPNSWKDGRKLCAVVDIWHQRDSVEFM